MSISQQYFPVGIKKYKYNELFTDGKNLVKTLLTYLFVYII